MLAKEQQLKKTVKHSAIYAVGTVVRRLTGLVMLPIYTRYLTPEDYGVVELLTMAIEIAGILVGLRISQAMFRYYILAEDDSEKEVIVSTVLITVLCSSIVGASLMFIAAKPLAILLFGSASYVYEFQLFTLTLITNAVAAVGLSYLRVRQMPIYYVSIGIVALFLQVVLNVIFVVRLELHVTGVVYSSLISGFVIALILTLYVIKSVGIHYSHELVGKLVRFVMPLIAASIGSFYVAYADKYFIRLFGSLADVGLYALAARVCTVLSTAYDAFNMSWAADRFEIVKNDNARAVYRQIFRLISVVIIIMGAGLALFSSDLFQLMTSPEFYSAGYIVPIMVIAIVLRIYSMYCNFGALYAGDTRIMAEASWIKAVIASVGYLVLIPYLGVYGAAISLVIGNAIELVWTNKKSIYHYDMGLQWAPVLLMCLAAIAAVAIGLMMPVGDVEYFVFRLAIYTLLLIIFWWLPIWEAGEKEHIVSLFVAVLRRDRRENLGK